MTSESTDPRVARTRQRILAAARNLLAAEGQPAVTPTRLAKETGISRSTIYRNWDDPAQITLDAISDHDAEPPFEPSGDHRQDLVRYLQLLRDGLNMPHTNLLASRMEQAEHQAAVAGQLRSASASRRQLIARILGRSDKSFDAGHALLVGPLFFQRFLAREPISDAFIASIVDSYLLSEPIETYDQTEVL